MALNTSPESSTGVFNAIKGALGIFQDINKAGGVTENENPQPIDEFESSMDEREIVELVGQWKRTYAVYYAPIEKSQEESFKYWIGDHKSDGLAQKSETNIIDNLIFEAVETFLPIATRANPDPLVTADPSEIGQQIAKDIKAALTKWADDEKLRRKLARGTRHWVIYRIGVFKITWDFKTKSIKLDVINPKRMIFDKDGYIDEGGNFVGEYIGEKKQATAERLAQMFPKKKEEIMRKAKDKKGTKLEYFEWWYKGEELFFTMDESVLGKFKNPNWNYDGKIKDIDPVTGEEIETEVQGTNHFKERKSPYVFINIFSTGLQPHDETSLILQNIPIQDKINRRERQIDDNVKGMNNGMVVSGTAFTEEQATQAASALRRGVAIRVPNGDVQKAVMRTPAPALPRDVFQDLQDGRSELRNIFGTAGSNAESLAQQNTVRGKIMVNQQDSSRIGGGVTEQIEQVADTIYNWVVQFMYVYYDEEHYITTAGQQAGMELIALTNQKFPLLKTLNITVKEGSLIPKDPLTQRNESLDLWSAGAIDPLTLMKRLEVPDPVQATNQLILWQMLQKGQIQPQMYLPTFAIAGQTPQQGLPPTQGVGGPAVNTIDASQQQPQQQPPTSQGAVQQQSSQLLGSVPLSS